VTLTWTAPYNGGSPITAYTIDFQLGGGAVTFSTEPNYCDGSALATLTSRKCVVPMATLRAAPLNLALDELVKAKIAATNAVGQGPFSAVNVAGVRI
jgi:hypothetical protein